MGRAIKAGIALAAIAAVGVIAHDWYTDRGIGFRVDVIGEAPIQVFANPGQCQAAHSFRDKAGSAVTGADCGSSGTRVRISVRCSDKDLPEAVIEREFEPRSTSNYVQLRNVCSSTAAQIVTADSRGSSAGIWESQ